MSVSYILLRIIFNNFNGVQRPIFYQNILHYININTNFNTFIKITRKRQGRNKGSASHRLSLIASHGHVVLLCSWLRRYLNCEHCVEVSRWVTWVLEWWHPVTPERGIFWPHHVPIQEKQMQTWRVGMSAVLHAASTSFVWSRKCTKTNFVPMLGFTSYF